MAFRLADNTRNRACNNLVQTIDTGGTTNATGQILVYTGSQPATPATTATGSLLVTIPFNNPSFGSSATGTATMVTSPTVSATVTGSNGTAGWFRVIDRATNAVFDGSCGTSLADMNWDNTTFVTGGTATINSMTITVPM
jgi:hypothetical protein